MSVDESDWAAAVQLLTSYDEVALACHVGPDGDALGSMLALGLALQGRGTKVQASFGSEPFEVPTPYRSLPGQDLLVPAADLPEAPGLLVTFDTGSVDRLGSLASRVDAATDVLVLDHHVTNTRFGSVNVVDEQAAATAVVVLDLIDRLGLPLTAEVAAPLYTGLVTDTGSFKYAATTPAVHEIAARLLATKAMARVAATNIFFMRPVLRALSWPSARLLLKKRVVGSSQLCTIAIRNPVRQRGDGWK